MRRDRRAGFNPRRGLLWLVVDLFVVVGGTIRWFYRLLAGRPLDGQRRTDSTFWRHGTKPISERDYTGRWQFIPGWQRAAVRVAVPAAVVAVGVAWMRNPAAVLTAAHTLAVVGVLALAVFSVLGARRWRLNREVVWPLAAALRPVLGHHESRPVRAWLHVPAGVVDVPASQLQVLTGKALDRIGEARDAHLAEHPDSHAVQAWAWLAGVRSSAALGVRPAREKVKARTRIRIDIPAEHGAVSAEMRTALLAHSTVKLGGSWTPEWKLRGSAPALILRPKLFPPRLVDFAMIRERLELMGPTELGLGIGPGLRTVSVDLDIDSPHVLLSMGSGGGKSVAIRLLIAQALRKGWAVILLDYKQDHYSVADLIDAGVPGVYYLRKPADIHQALINLETVRVWRSDMAFNNRNNPIPMQRVLIVFEEMNITANMLKAYWLDVKEKGDSPRSPALAALGQLAGAGRSAGMHLGAIGQYLTSDAFGPNGNTARESFSVRIMGRYTPNAWKTLASDYGPPPPKSSIQGRVQVCASGVRNETQIAFLTHAEVLEYAMAGLAGVIPAGELPFAWEPQALTPGERVELPSRLRVVPALEVADPVRQLVSLGEATGPDGVLAGRVSLDAARKARTRDPKFPPSVGQRGQELLYLPADLDVWCRERVRAGDGEAV